MWSDDFAQRLSEWKLLRETCVEQELETCLLQVNDWWWRVPTVNHYLHWDDHRNWPGPWDLLADNMFCDLARALGIVYTLLMVPRTDIQEISLLNSKQDNLVQVNKGKYILNWCPTKLLNIQSLDDIPRKRLSSTIFKDSLG
jgi:hypothetical protein